MPNVRSTQAILSMTAVRYAAISPDYRDEPLTKMMSKSMFAPEGILNDGNRITHAPYLHAPDGNRVSLAELK